MKRGTIIAAANSQVAARIKQDDWLLPSFNPGSTDCVPIFKPMKNWLATQMLDGQPVFSGQELDLLDQAYQVFHGDRVIDGRGEVFLAAG